MVAVRTIAGCAKITIIPPTIRQFIQA